MKKMRLSQRGLLPAITKLLGFVLPAYPFGLNVKYVIDKINMGTPELVGDSQTPDWLLFAMVFFFVMIFPVFFGMFFASIFPSMEPCTDGVRFSYWFLIGSKVKWNEIGGLVYYPNGYVVLRVDKYGLPFLNGQYFNMMRARFIDSQLPILIFSPGLEKREELIAEIRRNCSVRVAYKKDYQ
jgi:hypothetical protein